MNIRDLKYITSVASESGFAQAAKLCNVSQPALSMQIKKLEDELGVKIFERSQKNFLVTKVGKEIIAQAKLVLRQVEEMKTIASNAKDPLGGEIRIGTFPTLAPYLFPKITGKISAKFSRLKLLLVEEKTDILIEKLKSGELDLAMLALPISDKDFVHKKIFSEPFLLAVSSKNKLAKKPSVLRKDLQDEKMLLLEEGHCLRDQALDICYSSGAKEEQTFRATSLETLKQMIALGDWVTLVPEIAATHDKRLAYVKVSGGFTREIGMFWRKTFARSELAEGVVEVIKLSI